MIASNPLNLDLESPYEPSNTEHAVFSLLATYLPEASSIIPNQAAEQINALFPSHLPGPKEEKRSTTNFLFEFWELMFCIAPQLDYQHEPMQRFIYLVKALTNIPETIFIRYEDIYDGHSVWRRIPENVAPEDLYALRWRNMNGLLAHFTNHNICSNTSHAFVCISTALEEFRRKKPKIPINHHVTAAAIWFVLCSSMIYQACQQEECADRELSGNLWEGEPQQGYSIARWSFWRKKFGGLECHSAATEETKEACRAAIQEMDRYSVVFNDFDLCYGNLGLAGVEIAIGHVNIYEI